MYSWSTKIFHDGSWGSLKVTPLKVMREPIASPWASYVRCRQNWSYILLYLWKISTIAKTRLHRSSDLLCAELIEPRCKSGELTRQPARRHYYSLSAGLQLSRCELGQFTDMPKLLHTAGHFKPRSLLLHYRSCHFPR